MVSQTHLMRFQSTEQMINIKYTIRGGRDTITKSVPRQLTSEDMEGIVNLAYQTAIGMLREDNQIPEKAEVWETLEGERLLKVIEFKTEKPNSNGVINKRKSMLATSSAAAILGAAGLSGLSGAGMPPTPVNRFPSGTNFKPKRKSSASSYGGASMKRVGKTDEGILILEDSGGRQYLKTSKGIRRLKPKKKK